METSPKTRCFKHPSGTVHLHIAETLHPLGVDPISLCGRLFRGKSLAESEILPDPPSFNTYCEQCKTSPLLWVRTAKEEEEETK